MLLEPIVRQHLSTGRTQSGMVIEHGIGQSNQFRKRQLGLPQGETSRRICHLELSSRQH